MGIGLALVLLLYGFAHIFTLIVVIAFLVDFYWLRSQEKWKPSWGFLSIVALQVAHFIWPLLRATQTPVSERASFARITDGLIAVSAVLILIYLYRRYRNVGLPFAVPLERRA